MNLFHATIEDGQVVFGTHRLPIPPSPALCGHRGPLVVGIRPSDFEDADVWRDEARAVLEVAVDVIEELGADANVLFTLDAPPALEAMPTIEAEPHAAEPTAPLVEAGRTQCTACVDARTQARPGGRVRLSIDPARLHFFDVASGAALATGEPAVATAG